MTKPLWKTSILIWTDYDPQNFEIDSLSYQAMEGDAYCSAVKIDYVANPDLDTQWDDAEFFLDPFDPDNAGCDVCGTYDRIPGTELCVHCAEEATANFFRKNGSPNANI